MVQAVILQKPARPRKLLQLMRQNFLHHRRNTTGRLNQQLIPPPPSPFRLQMAETTKRAHWRKLQSWSRPTGLAVATFINESFVSIALSQRQIGLLAGLGPNKSNRVGEQRKAGRGSRPSATKVLALIMARKLLTMAGCLGVDELCTYGDHTKEQVEAEGALDAGKIIHTLPHPVTTCPEWTAACKSTLKASVQKNGASSGSFTSANVIKVFWALLAGSQARCPASEAIFNKGVSALESDTKMPLVVKNWLSQSKSQAATVKKEFGFKGQSKRLAADVDVNTSPETTEKKAREEADVLSDNAAASS
mmetsp:Transcript_37460/g.63808  ORF Transcript_37460/g.63808 Transcript_37460/m.63808 type:complete len:306 (+) Transcript_37460:242-1159(+)